MSIVVPFRALRPLKKYVKDAASYPYDIMDLEEARKIANENPLSFLHVERSEVDMPEDGDIISDEVHQLARKRLQRLIKDGIFIRDEKPCFYVYRQRAEGREQTGIVAGVSAEEYAEGLIKKHELTRVDKELDRIKHIDTVNAQTGLVFLLYRNQDAITRIVNGITETPPEYDFVKEDGIAHTVWVVRDEETLQAIQKEFAKVDCLYIADGHHRAASAAEIAGMRKRANLHHRGDEGYNFIMATLLPHDQLKILDYNRLVKDLNGLTEQEILRMIREKFDIFPGAELKSPTRQHEFGMYLGGRWYRLAAKETAWDGKDLVGGLDVSILQNNLLMPVFGIVDPRTDDRIKFAGGIQSVEEMQRLVDWGRYAVAFALYPPTVEQLMKIADSGFIMPPKSTWFEPKLRSGIFVHLLD
jgi:uncharacterized protein (DUF1015 family)